MVMIHGWHILVDDKICDIPPVFRAGVDNFGTRTLVSSMMIHSKTLYVLLYGDSLMLKSTCLMGLLFN